MELWQEIVLALPYALTTIITITVCGIHSIKRTTLNFRAVLLQLLWFAPILIVSMLSSILVESNDSAIIFLKIFSYLLPFLGYFALCWVLTKNRDVANKLEQIDD